MEMPEGWKKLAKAVVEMRKWELETDSRVAVMDAYWCGDMATTLSLMKEMAVALDEMDRAEMVSAIGYDVLQKFKEWK